MRADAEVDEGLAATGRVAGDVRLAGRLLLDQLNLERLALAGEKRQRLVARPHLPLVGQVARRQLPHLLFDGGEVFRHERPVDNEVVEEPLVGRRADAALRARERVQ